MKFSDWRKHEPAVDYLDLADGNDLLAAAGNSARLRSHILLHENHADPVQRLLVGFAAGTYIQPHMHSQQWELIIPLQGELAVLGFSDERMVTSRTVVSAETTPVLQIQQGQWHSIVAMTATALMMEFKPGPFRPAEFAAWSPTEGSDGVRAMRDWLRTAVVGDIAPG